MREWRHELEDAIARARAAAGDDEVRAALAELAEGLDADSVPTLAPSVAVLGVAACDIGRIGVLVRPSGHTSLHVGGSLSGLIEQVREQESLGIIGLADADLPDARAWLSTRPTVEVVEVAFRPSTPGERRERLITAGVTIPVMYSGMGFTEEHLLAACEAALEVARLWS